jgi:hypothetical protein
MNIYKRIRSFDIIFFNISDLKVILLLRNKIRFIMNMNHGLNKASIVGEYHE